MKLIKKSFAVLLTLAILLSLTGAASAMGLAEGTCGLHATWELSFAGGLTIAGNGDIKAYAPKSSVDFRKYSAQIKSVMMKDGITGVGAYAFQSMTALTSVKMTDNVLTIDRYAFADCPVLSDITLPSTLLFIGANAFSNCTSLKSAVIPAGITNLYAKTFAGCTALKTVEIRNKNCVFAINDILPQGVTVVGYTGSTAQYYAQKNGMAFQVLSETGTEQTTQPATQPTSGTATTTDAGKCPLCGQTHEGFPDSLIGGVHSFIYWLLMLFGMRS